MSEVHDDRGAATAKAATLELLTKAEGLFDNMAQFGRPTPELQYHKAWMLIEFARNYALLGDTAQERAYAEEAFRLLAAACRRETRRHHLSARSVGGVR